MKYNERGASGVKRPALPLHFTKQTFRTSPSCAITSSLMLEIPSTTKNWNNPYSATP